MFHPGHCASRGREAFPCRGVWEEVMKNFGLVRLALAGLLLSNLGYSQQTQPAQPQPAQPAQRSQEDNANLDVGNTPTRSDMYCSGFLTTEKVPDKMFVAGGHNSPDQTRYHGASDV